MLLMKTKRQMILNNLENFNATMVARVLCFFLSGEVPILNLTVMVSQLLISSLKEPQISVG